jgi:stage V sporulation protein R
MNSEEIAALEQATERIWEVAQRLGLDPFPTHFDIVPAAIMYEFGAYGLPGRFSHWTHGRAYQQIKTMYDYGLNRIYELVINANPAYAFLLENNSVLQNKLVVAHVLGHSDFFKHNAHFRATSRQMLETVSVHAERLRGYEFRHGRDAVEQCLDAVLSIQEHIDPFPAMRRDAAEEPPEPARPPATPYDDLWRLGEKEPEAVAHPNRKTPFEPDKDLLLFIAEHARGLEEWQRDVLHIVRQEQLYFVPQMHTKIMNEGWAAYWHLRILRELELSQDEYLEFAGLHASVLAPSGRGINPYHVGLKVWEDIERRWDDPPEAERERLRRPRGQGRAKLFEVREQEDDVSFLRNYLTKDLVEELDLYLYRYDEGKWVIVEKDWEKVRDMLVASMTNFGQPYIVVEDGDYSRNHELYLRHCFEGQELDMDYAERTLRYVHQLWGRGVHVETVLDGKVTILSFDGDHVRTKVGDRVVSQ